MRTAFDVCCVQHFLSTFLQLPPRHNQRAQMIQTVLQPNPRAAAYETPDHSRGLAFPGLDTRSWQQQTLDPWRVKSPLGPAFRPPPASQPHRSVEMAPSDDEDSDDESTVPRPRPSKRDRGRSSTV